MTILIFLIILTVLVFVHELGHFLAAKKVDARVDEFAIGFPPRLFSWKRGETTYSINLIPFGGYVSIYGENPDQVNEKTGDISRSLSNKSRLAQAFVLSAGIIFNIIFAWVLLTVAYSIGFPSPVDNAFNMQVKDPKVTIVSVLPHSPADKAGLLPGDVITSLSSHSRDELTNGVVMSLPTVSDIQNQISKTDGSLSLSYIRGALHGVTEEKTISITPVAGLISSDPNHKTIGIALSDIGIVQASWYQAPWYGAQTTWILTVGTVTGLFSFFERLVSGAAHFNEVSGPVGIAKMVGEAQSFGFAYLISFAALISINLAVMNTLPIPALDGGRLFIIAIESIIRKPLPARAVTITHIAGFVFLIALMVLVTWSDIVKAL